MNSLEQIQQALGELMAQDAGAKSFSAIEGALTEIASALTDLVAVAEASKEGKGKNEDDEPLRAEAFANTIAAAIRSVRIEAPSVEVSAPSVTVTPTFNVPQPVINNEINVPPINVPPAQIVRDVSPIGTEWEFEITHNGMNNSKIKARKVK